MCATEGRNKISQMWQLILSQQQTNLLLPVSPGNLQFLPSLSNSVVRTRSRHSQSLAVHRDKCKHDNEILQVKNSGMLYVKCMKLPCSKAGTPLFSSSAPPDICKRKNLAKKGNHIKKKNSYILDIIYQLVKTKRKTVGFKGS